MGWGNKSLFAGSRSHDQDGCLMDLLTFCAKVTNYVQRYPFWCCVSVLQFLDRLFTIEP